MTFSPPSSLRYDDDCFHSLPYIYLYFFLKPSCTILPRLYSPSGKMKNKEEEGEKRKAGRVVVLPSTMSWYGDARTGTERATCPSNQSRHGIITLLISSFLVSLSLILPPLCCCWVERWVNLPPGEQRYCRRWRPVRRRWRTVVGGVGGKSSTSSTDTWPNVSAAVGATTAKRRIALLLRPCCERLCPATAEILDP